jgi:hypothetical protein
MIEGEEKPPVHETDNHELFIQEYNRFRKSDKFKLLTDTSKFLLLNGIEEHLQALVKLTSPALPKDKMLADEMAAVTDEMPVDEMGMDLGPVPEGAGDELALRNEEIADNVNI